MTNEARLNELLDLVEQARQEGDTATEQKAAAAYKLESTPQPEVKSTMPAYYKMLAAAKKTARSAGLAGRAVAEGGVGIVTAIPDAVGMGINAVNDMTGSHLPQYIPQSQIFSDALTRAGALVPETSGEQLTSAGIRSATGALAGGGLLGGMSVPNSIRTGLSGFTGGLGSEAARQSGAGPIGQMAAGIGAGYVPGFAEQTGRSIWSLANAGKNMVAPLVSTGAQEKIAANVLAGNAQDRAGALRNLDDAQPIVPGSMPTAGPASQDVGLMALQKGLQGKNPVPFGQRASEQNLARQQSLEDVAGSPADIAAAQSQRNAVTGPMREAALSKAGTADSAAVVNKIDTILASPVGKRDIPTQALGWVKQKIDGETNPANLYAVRQDIGDAMEGKLGGDQSKFRLARGQLMDVRSTLDDTIEAAAPGFKAYLQRYKDMSKPINQMEVMQEIQRRSQLQGAADITTGRQFLSPAKFTSQLTSALEKKNVQLDPKQVETLKAIKADLDMGAAINSPLLKAPGSDTFQNLSLANAIGLKAAKGGLPPAMQTLIRPLNWLYKLPDEKITEILTDAMLDPKIAAKLLRRATPQSTQTLSESLAVRARAYGVGATASQVSNLDKQEQDKDKRRADQ